MNEEFEEEGLAFRIIVLRKKKSMTGGIVPKEAVVYLTGVKNVNALLLFLPLWALNVFWSID